MHEPKSDPWYGYQMSQITVPWFPCAGGCGCRRWLWLPGQDARFPWGEVLMDVGTWTSWIRLDMVTPSKARLLLDADVSIAAWGSGRLGPMFLYFVGFSLGPKASRDPLPEDRAGGGSVVRCDPPLLIWPLFAPWCRRRGCL